MSDRNYGERSLARAFARRLVAWARDRGAAAAILPHLHRTAWALSRAIAAGHVCLPLASVEFVHEPTGGAADAVAGTDPADAPPVQADDVEGAWAHWADGADWVATDLADAWPDEGVADERPGDPMRDTLSGLQGLRMALLASGVVGAAGHPEAMPLVLDAGDRLYLHRHFDLEQRLARRLLSAAREPMRALDATACAAFEAVHPPLARADARTHGQRLAVALALMRSLVVISGGPGTGKTTTVARLLACLRLCNPTERIAIAAPTGKAAARVEQSLRAQGAFDARTPSAQTIHRLLGATQVPGVFRHGLGNPLPIDTLVVDEASMLDLALATQLLEAVPAGARIILLGDREQLASVDAGAVFAELSATCNYSDECLRLLAGLGIEPSRIETAGIEPGAMERDAREPDGSAADAAGGLIDSVVWLTENFRFDAGSGPGRMATAIRAGAAHELIDVLRDPSPGEAEWLADEPTRGMPAWVVRALQGYAAYLDCIAELARGTVQSEPALNRLFALLEGFRVLCALRVGARGVDAINAQLTLAVRRRHLHPDDPLEPSPWYAGRPVLILRNDYTAGLFNGDTGIAWPDAQAVLQVWFPTPDGSFRALSPARLPDHETAWALSVHKSQGSEFDRVLIVLPDEVHALLTRELIYTAVTRARLGACLAGQEAVIVAAVARLALRDSGLLARLREA